MRREPPRQAHLLDPPTAAGVGKMRSPGATNEGPARPGGAQRSRHREGGPGGEEAGHPRQPRRRHRPDERQRLLDGPDGLPTPNIDRDRPGGMIFTDYYAEQSCWSSFITGQCTFRTGLSKWPKVGVPSPPSASRRKKTRRSPSCSLHGYATGQFGKNCTSATNKYPGRRRSTGSTSSSATSTTSTLRRSPSRGTYPGEGKFKKRFGLARRAPLKASCRRPDRAAPLGPGRQGA